jgi:hypothetical protein
MPQLYLPQLNCQFANFWKLFFFDVAMSNVTDVIRCAAGCLTGGPGPMGKKKQKVRWCLVDGLKWSTQEQVSSLFYPLCIVLLPVLWIRFGLNAVPDPYLAF